MPWSDARHARFWRRTTAGLAIWMCLITAVGGWGLKEVSNTQSDNARQDRVDRARSCVVAWQLRPLTREILNEAIPEGGKLGAHIVVELARELEADLPEDINERIDRISEREIEPIIDRIVEQYPDPTCDRAAAQAVIDSVPNNNEFEPHSPN